MVIAVYIHEPEVPTSVSLVKVKLELEDMMEEKRLRSFETAMHPRIEWLYAQQLTLDEQHRWNDDINNQFGTVLDAYDELQGKLWKRFHLYEEEVEWKPDWKAFIPEIVKFGLSPYERALRKWQEGTALLIYEYDAWHTSLEALVLAILQRIAHMYREEDMDEQEQ